MIWYTIVNKEGLFFGHGTWHETSINAKWYTTLNTATIAAQSLPDAGEFSIIENSSDESASLSTRVVEMVTVTDDQCYCGKEAYAELGGMPLCIDCLHAEMDEEDLQVVTTVEIYEPVPPGTIIEWNDDFYE